MPFQTYTVDGGEGLGRYRKKHGILREEIGIQENKE
jgi:hypothetical protein